MVKIGPLTDEQRRDLERGRRRAVGRVSQRAHMVLLSARGYTVRQIAEIVAEEFPGCTTTFGDLAGDNRSYRVNFDKIRTHLPDFACSYSARDGARELRATFERIGMTTEDFKAPPFTRLKQLERLLKTKQLDRWLRWTD